MNWKFKEGVFGQSASTELGVVVHTPLIPHTGVKASPNYMRPTAKHKTRWGVVVHTLKQEDLSQFEASLVWYQSVPVSKTKQTNSNKNKKPQICSFIPFVRQGLTLYHPGCPGTQSDLWVQPQPPECWMAGVNCLSYLGTVSCFMWHDDYLLGVVIRRCGILCSHEEYKALF